MRNSSPAATKVPKLIVIGKRLRALYIDYLPDPHDFQEKRTSSWPKLCKKVAGPLIASCLMMVDGYSQQYQDLLCFYPQVFSAVSFDPT